MNKIAIIGLAAFAGCATTKQVEELAVKLDGEKIRCEELEQRLSRIEGDLYHVEVKSAPKSRACEAEACASAGNCL